MTSLDVLQDAMPRQKSLTLIPRQAEDFPRGDNHSRHVPLSTYLAGLQPISCNSRFVYIHVNIGKGFTCGKNFNKKYRAAAKLISNH